MMKAVHALLYQYRELVSYVFWGAATTLVNYGAYFLLTEGLRIHYLAGNCVAWAVSVLFAYFVNKLFVFQSRTWAWQVALRELWQMTASRLLTLGLETAILWIFVDMLHYGDTIVKLAASVVVVAANYVLSKFVIFKKKPG